MPKKGYRQTAEHRAKIAQAQGARPPVTVECVVCGAAREVPAYYASRYKTCGADACRRSLATRPNLKNQGRVRSAEARSKNSAATRGRTQSPEHVAARTEARLKAGWWKDPDATAAKIGAAHAGQERPSRRGAGNPMWRGGVSSLPQGHRGSSEYAAWRFAVLDRDGWRCQVCGTDQNVIAHHILSWHFHPQYRTDVNNGISLCRSCHVFAHGYVKHFHKGHPIN